MLSLVVYELSLPQVRHALHMSEHLEVTLYATIDPTASFDESNAKPVQELRHDFNTLPMVHSAERYAASKRNRGTARCFKL